MAAFDFSNRDPQDPRGVATITPYAVPDAWLPAGEGDWSQYATDPTTAASQGLTRKVSLAQVTLNNGEQYFAVQDAKGKPIDLIGDRTGVDDKQHAAFVQSTNAATPNSGSTTQKRTGPDGVDHIYQWNPQTRQYDTDLGAVQGVGPPGGKPYIDDGAEAGKSGRRWGWNQQTHAYDRDLGPSPAAQLPTTASDRKPVDGRPGYSQVTTRNAQTNQTETHYEKDDNPGVAVQLPGDTKNENVTYRKNAAGQLEKVTTSTVNGQRSESVVPVLPSERTQVGTKTATANGKTVKVTTWQLPDGSTIDTTDEDTPGPKPGQMVDIDGRKFWASPDPDPSQPPTLTAMNPGAGTQPADNGPQFAPGMTSSDYLSARRQYWMDQRRAGVSQADINAGWNQDVQIASQRSNEESTAASQQNQRLSSAMSGFSQAATTADDINRYLPVGSDLAGKGLAADLILQRGQAQRMGGYGPMGGQPAPAYVPSTSRTVTPPGPDPSTQVAAIPAAPAPVAAPAAGPIPGVHMVTPPVPTSPQPAAVAPPPVGTAAIAAATQPAAPAAAPPSVTPAGAGSRNMDTQPGAPMMPNPAPATSPDDILTLRHPNGDAVYITRANWDASTPEARASYQVINAENGTIFRARQPTVQAAADAGTPPTPAPSPTAPDYGAPGMSVLPDPSAAPTPSLPYNPDTDPSPPPMGANDLTMAPGYGMPTMAMAPSGAIPVAAIPESPYDFAARIASSPPWRMSEQDHQRAQAMGLGDSFWSVPGSSAA